MRLSSALFHATIRQLSYGGVGWGVTRELVPDLFERSVASTITNRNPDDIFFLERRRRIVVECARLESEYTERYQRFESSRLRQKYESNII